MTARPRRAPAVLPSPSEGKAAGGDGPPWQPGTGVLPAQLDGLGWPNDAQQAMIQPWPAGTPRISSVSAGWKKPSTVVSELPTPNVRAASMARVV